ncbi:MAG TPA: helix-turn-helix transcriptional regulator [Streptosporangiaceae bacterium]|nr:helix-turn-helix transcriptional regulator [Streptosporangiaceae bacterium]
MPDPVKGDRTVAMPAAIRRVPAETYDQSCPHRGGELPGRDATRNIMLKAMLSHHIESALMRTRSLSQHEVTVFELLGLSYDNRTLARVLKVSERTAKRHVTAILAKLGLESRLQAGLVALLTTSLPPRTSGGPKVAWTSAIKADDTELQSRPNRTGGRLRS